jgi:hypothetical protein
MFAKQQAASNTVGGFVKQSFLTDLIDRLLFSSPVPSRRSLYPSFILVPRGAGF